jgi:hypothetical protein
MSPTPAQVATNQRSAHVPAVPDGAGESTVRYLTTSDTAVTSQPTATATMATHDDGTA